MTTLDGFKYECEYGNRNLLLAMADEAEERGDDRLARGFRWLHHNRKWPQRVKDSGHEWCWFCSPHENSERYGGFLPHHARMRAGATVTTGQVTDALFYETCYGALEAAALAFWPRWKKGRKPRT